MSSNLTSCPSTSEEIYSRILTRFGFVIILKSYWIPIISVYASILAASWLGNCLVLLAIIKTRYVFEQHEKVHDKRSLHTVTNLFCASLAFSDMMTCLMGFVVIYTDINIEYIFSPVLCAVYNYTVGCTLNAQTLQDPFGFSSILSLTVISVERFRLVVFPHLLPWSKREAVLIVLV